MTQPVLICAGTVRGDVGTKVWNVLDNSGHKPYGIDLVEKVGNAVRVHYADEAGNPLTIAYVGTANADPDDTLAINSISTGPSVGLSYVDIKFGKNGAQISPDAACIDGANVWVEVKGYLS